MAPVGTAPATAQQQQTCAVGDVRPVLRSLLSQVRDLIGGMDPDAVVARDAVEVWDLCGELARLCTGAQTLVARRVAEAGAYKTAGARDTAEFLALRSGVSKSAMAQMLATSHRLAHQPVAAAAVRRGELSADQAHAVTDAAGTDLSEQRRLVTYARGRSLKELRDEALRTKAVADPAPEQTRRRQHDERHFRQGTGADGRWWFKGEGPPEDRARFEAALNPFIETAFRQARRQGRKESRDVLAYDALQALARHTHQGHPATPGDPDPGHDTSPNAGERPSSHNDPSHRRSGRRPDGHKAGSESGSQRQDTEGSPPQDTTNWNNSPSRRHPIRGREPGDQGGDVAGHPGSQGTTGGHDAPSRRHVEDGSGDGREPAAREGSVTGSAAAQGTADGNKGPVQSDDPGRSGSLAGQADRSELNSTAKLPVKARRRASLSLLPVLRLDLAALRRGYLLTGELCEITSNGPLTLMAARELLGASIVKLVLTRYGEVTTVAHLGRCSPTPTQLAILHADVSSLAVTAGPRLRGQIPACWPRDAAHQAGPTLQRAHMVRKRSIPSTTLAVRIDGSRSKECWAPCSSA